LYNRSMSKREKLKCWLDDDLGLSQGLIIVEDGEYYGLWIDGDINDGFDPENEMEEMISHYGDLYYLSKEAYKNSDGQSISKWIEEACRKTS